MKGFTLTEILVSLSIFVILVFAIFAVMGIGRGAWFTGNISVELRQEIIRAFRAMDKELRETRPAQISLAIASSSATLTFTIPQDNDGDGTILDSLGNIEWSGDIIYALSDAGEITRTRAGTTTVLARNITNLQFSRPTTPVDLLQIDVSAQKTSVVGRQMQDAGQTIIKMRN